MRKIAVLVALCMVAFIPTLASAGVKNVQIGGEINSYLQWSDNYEQGTQIGTKKSSSVLQSLDGSGTAVAHSHTNGETFLRTRAIVYVSADLDENVSTLVSVEADRVWGLGDSQSPSDLAVEVLEAKVALDEVFGFPIDSVIGRQYITWGEGFVIGDSNPYIVTDRSQAQMWIIDPFDAVCATYDAAPWTVDVMYAKIDEQSTSQDTQDLDDDLAGVKLNYAGWNKQSVDGYFLWEKDANAPKANAITRNTLGLYNDPNQVFAVGLKADGDILPVEGLTYRLEGTYEFGTYAKCEAGSPAVDIGAFGGYMGAKYEFGGNPYSPFIDGMWVFLQGEEAVRAGDMNQFYPFYTSEVYGEIFKEYVQSNAHILKLAGGFDPIEPMNISLAFYHYIAEEGRYVANSAVNTNENLGNELDLTVTYKYTDDVVLGLGVAHYFPGDIFEKSVAGADGTTAVTGSCKVKF